MVARVDDKRLGTSSIFHVDCNILVSSVLKSGRCSACTKHRKSLSTMASRPKSDDRTHPSSHTTYAALTTPEKEERLHRLHRENARLKSQIARLREKISTAVDRDGVTVDSELNEDLKDMVEKSRDEVHKSYPEGTFQRIFWEEQEKAMSLKDSRSMRWHPVFIKWCLYLRHLSGRSYELLRESGCIHLPSQRTLRDYIHYIPAKVGFSAEIDQQLIDAIDFSKETNRYVTLLLDEVHIKEDLVYDKHSGSLIGFTNMGDINNHLMNFERSLADEPGETSIASSVLVIMVRGLLSKLNFPYAQFAVANLSGDLMVDPVWEAISRLERQGIRVLALTCDGASANRRLWKLHSKGRDTSERGVLYKVPNIYATDQSRFLYFISDPPHLIKTTRNCWANKSRKLEVGYSKFLLPSHNLISLQCNGKLISWDHLKSLYLEDTEAGYGIRRLPKLKYEHIHLTSFSKMRVDLAAQVNTFNIVLHMY